MIYILTEYNGNGSGFPTTFNTKREAMDRRRCTLTYNAAIKKYGKNYFYATDRKCSTIDSYTSKKAMEEGRMKTTATWY